MMKRLQIMIEEELDAALATRALETNRSKASIIREIVRERLLQAGSQGDEDPIWNWIGGDEGEPVEDVDDAVYPR